MTKTRRNHVFAARKLQCSWPKRLPTTDPGSTTCPCASKHECRFLAASPFSLAADIHALAAPSDSRAPQATDGSTSGAQLCFGAWLQESESGENTYTKSSTPSKDHEPVSTFGPKLIIQELRSCGGKPTIPLKQNLQDVVESDRTSHEQTTVMKDIYPKQ